LHPRWYQLSSTLALTTVLSLGCDRAERVDRGSSSAESRDSSNDSRVAIGYGVMAGDDPGLTYKGYQPLMDHLTAHTPFLFQLRLARTSDDLLRYVEERMAEIVPLSSVSYLESHVQFGAVPLVRPLNRESQPVTQSVFVVRRGSPLRDLVDLKGRSLALGSFHSTWSNLIPRHELLRAGVSLEDLERLEHFDNDEAVAAAVLEGRFDAGAVEDVVAYRHQEELEPLHASDPLPSDPLVIRDDLPTRVSQTVREAFLSLDFHQAQERQHWDENVRYGFAPAADSDYHAVREILKTVPTRCEGTCHGNP